MTIDPQKLKIAWFDALREAEMFIKRRPPEEAGCLYYAVEKKAFVDPDRGDVGPVVPHYGRPGGVLPRVIEDSR